MGVVGAFLGLPLVLLDALTTLQDEKVEVDQQREVVSAAAKSVIQEPRLHSCEVLRATSARFSKALELPFSVHHRNPVFARQC